MKKFILIAVLALFAMPSKALIRLYCGTNGNLFVINWGYDINNNLTYTVSYDGPCYGGPWSAGIVVKSPQEAGSTTEASLDIYRTLVTYTANPHPNSGYNDDVSHSGDYVSYNITPVWVNPENIDGYWAKVLAQSEGKSVYALTLVDHPYRGYMKFNVWSIQSETVTVKLRDVNNNSTALSTTASLSEGKNQITNISLSGVSSGNYILSIESSGNIITQTVTVN